MVKIIRTCRRCGRLVDEVEAVWFDCPDTSEAGCEYCNAEYEALLERQKEERRLFWRENEGDV